MAEIDIKRFPRIVTTKNQDNMDLKQGADLPPVTEDDNGDVLTVVDGVWDKAAPSGGEVVILKFNSSFNALVFEDDTAVNPSNFPFDNVPNVYLKSSTNDLCRISKVKTGSTTELDFVGFSYDIGYTTVKQFVYYVFRSSGQSTQFSLFTSVINPALPSIGPNDGGKYLAVKSDGKGLEWVSPAAES